MVLSWDSCYSRLILCGTHFRRPFAFSTPSWIVYLILSMSHSDAQMAIAHLVPSSLTGRRVKAVISPVWSKLNRFFQTFIANFYPLSKPEGSLRYFWNIRKTISNELCSFGNNKAFHADLSLVAMSQRSHRRQVEWRFLRAIKSCSAPNIIGLFTVQYFPLSLQLLCRRFPLV